MTAQHTPGPWAVEIMPSGAVTITAGQLFVVGPKGQEPGLDADDAARIVQCVNAHDGLVAALRKNIDVLLTVAQELRQPRMPLPTAAAVSVRLLAEAAQDSLVALPKATGTVSMDPPTIADLKATGSASRAAVAAPDTNPCPCANCRSWS